MTHQSARDFIEQAKAEKQPEAWQLEQWPWFWVWPDRSLSVDPRAGVERRHHVSDRAFQVAIKRAALQAGLNKRVTPHVLRRPGCGVRSPLDL